MMKLLYIPTGNLFTLPDEKALSYYNSDKDNYKILDAGFITEQPPQKLEPKTVQELVMQTDDEEEGDKPQSIADQVVEKEPEDLNKLTKPALVAYCRRLGIKGVTTKNRTKAQLIEAIEKVTLKDIVGE